MMFNLQIRHRKIFTTIISYKVGHLKQYTIIKVTWLWFLSLFLSVSLSLNIVYGIAMPFL